MSNAEYCGQRSATNDLNTDLPNVGHWLSLVHRFQNFAELPVVQLVLVVADQ